MMGYRSVLCFAAGLAAAGVGCGDNGVVPTPTPPNNAVGPTTAAVRVDSLRVVPLSALGHDRLYTVAFAPSGAFFAAGTVADSTDASADLRTVVAKFTPAGVLDGSFGSGGVATQNVAVGTGGEVPRGLVVQSTGKVVVLTSVEHAGASDPRDRDLALVRFHADGALDTTFGTAGVALLDLSDGVVNGSSYVADSGWNLVAYADDRLLVSAAMKHPVRTDTDWVVVRLSADGARDAGFGPTGNGLSALVDCSNRSATVREILLQPDGSIVGSGYTNDGGIVKPVVFKLTDAGLLDTTFGTGGLLCQQVLDAITEIYALVPQGGSFVTMGYGRSSADTTLDWLSLRVTAAGALDTGYATAGVARFDGGGGLNDNGRALVALPDGRLLGIGGGRPSASDVDGMLALTDANGAPDTDFGANGVRLVDLGGPSDMLWSGAVAPSGTSVAIVGTKGVAAPGNDDAVVVLLTIDQ